MPRFAPLLLAVFLVACSEPDRSAAPTEPASAETDGIPFDIEGKLAFVRGIDTLKTIAIEIADTDSTRMRGLMQRPEIPDNTGMLFVFPYAERQSFWMANTPHPLDIQYYAADSTLLNIAENTTPYSQAPLPSQGDAQFVVEVPAGYSRRLGLVQGDRITWTTAD